MSSERAASPPSTTRKYSRIQSICRCESWTIMSSLCPIRSWHTQLIPVANAFSSRALSTCDNMTSKYNSIIIIGGGIAGLSTARYILQHEKNIEVTIVDKNNLPGKQLDPYLTYDKQQVDLLHYNIPSRRNGNVLCPSLTIPWTTRSLWSEAFLPLLKSYFGKKGKGSMPTTISFDVPSLLTNTNMVRSTTNLCSHHKCNIDTKYCIYHF